MNVVREIRKLNEREINQNYSESASWHAQYKDSAYIFVGGLPFDLNEGDVIAIFSQYGEIMDINLIRDRETGKSKGFAFLKYEDQRSTVLAVDNFNGAKVLGRTLRVDHVLNYRQPKTAQEQADLDEFAEKPYYRPPACLNNFRTSREDTSSMTIDSPSSSTPSSSARLPQKAAQEQQQQVVSIDPDQIDTVQLDPTELKRLKHEKHRQRRLIKQDSADATADEKDPGDKNKKPSK